MKYFPDWGNLLLSIGSEQEVFVWAMDNTIADPLYGKMKGHKAPCSDLARFPKQPFAITIDTAGTVKLWDVRYLSCLQTIAKDKSMDLNMRLVMIGRESFLTVGIRFKIFQVSGSV